MPNEYGNKSPILVKNFSISCEKFLKPILYGWGSKDKEAVNYRALFALDEPL
jgi:hypothetical protein